MKPNIELNIDELVLHGFKPSDRYQIGEAVERELLRLISEQGLPENFTGSVNMPHLEAGSFSLTSCKAEVVGSEVARMIHASLNGNSQQGPLTTQKKR